MSQQSQTVLVTGANGYIGNAVCRAFVQAGWIVYGLVRKLDTFSDLAAEEIIPIQGSIGDNAFVPVLLAQQKTFNVIVSTTEILGKFESHFQDIVSMLLVVSEKSNEAGVRPLVMFTSGCKDYGMTGRADSEDLAPHTEASPLNPPAVVAERCLASPKIFEYPHAFDAVILRPTTVFGRSGSYYGPFFELAQLAKETATPLILPADPRSIVHGTHVDDCANAYLSIAESDRARVAGQCYNISSRRYETLDEIAEVLVEEYGLEKGIVYDPPQNKPVDQFDIVQFLTGFSQWVGSDKLRQDVGWKDRRLLFTEGLKAYRLAYEAAAKSGHSNVTRVKGYMKAFAALN
ncbi:NAD-dependent epimerase/dehydratase [Penicillium camemberti]|uniref:NAD-dependent epimerase/dehydratase n=1 Tax=Penicillium camemberti (strain FM 013) TaxID=1429867 RepID=A0A0G4PN48_PENC3|nr:NAD-dependent epimerase/dehydratase [Penicillium camemberti]